MPVQMKNPAVLHTNRPLDMMSVAYIQSQDDFIADLVFRNIPVDKQSDLYYQWPKGTWFRTDVQPRSPGANPPRISWKPLRKTYLAENWEVAHDIFDEERVNADNEFDLDSIGVDLLTQQHLIHREMEWAKKFYVPGVWARERDGVTTGPTGTQFLRWNDASSDPMKMLQLEVLLMKEATGIRPNTLVISPYIEVELTNHPLILERIKYTGVAKATGIATPGAGTTTFRQMLAELFNVPRILVAEAVVNSASEMDDDAPPVGATGMHYIFGKSALLCYAAPNPGKRVPSAGYTFSWRGLTGASNMGMKLTKAREDVARKDVIIMEQAFDQKVIAPDLGVFLTNVIT